jgi:hypothetical protein
MFQSTLEACFSTVANHVLLRVFLQTGAHPPHLTCADKRPKLNRKRPPQNPRESYCLFEDDQSLYCGPFFLINGLSDCGNQFPTSKARFRGELSGLGPNQSRGKANRINHPVIDLSLSYASPNMSCIAQTPKAPKGYKGIESDGQLTLSHNGPSGITARPFFVFRKSYGQAH